MTWGHRICKTVIINSVVGLALLVLTEFCLPTIYVYLWQLPASPAKNIEGILAHRVTLKNLETELNTVLHATSHPVNDHTISRQNEISQQYEKLFAMIEDYNTKEHGKLEDFDGLIRIHDEIIIQIFEFVVKDEELNRERLEFIAGLVQRVADTTEPTNMKLKWTLWRQFEKMKAVGMQFDQKQPQLDVENAKIGVSNSEDEACIKVLQKLSKLLNKADDVAMRMRRLAGNELKAQRSEKPMNGTTNFDWNIDLEQLLLVRKLIKRGFSELLMADNKKLLGKTKLFMTAATTRVKNLLLEVIEKEDVRKEEMNSVLIKFREEATKSNRLSVTLLSNMTLRIPRDLDQEANDHSEL